MWGLGFSWLADDDRILVADYEAARMPCAAADLGRRMRWYRSNVVKRGEEVVKG
jgi:hypothetical protein